MNNLPFVSVILPVRNEEKYIEAALAAVTGQDYPADRMEIIVVDGMSTDGTREIVGRLAANDTRVRLCDNPKGIAPTAMNIGIAISPSFRCSIPSPATVIPPYSHEEEKILGSASICWIGL